MRRQRQRRGWLWWSLTAPDCGAGWGARLIRLAAALAFALLLSPLAAQPAPETTPPPAADCQLPAPVFLTGEPNIFNDRQEQDLGDALAEYTESDLRLVAPPPAGDELTRIGERLLATLPPTGVHYRFRVYDSGEVNGFSLAGGRVYISRKMVAAVQSEDELAGVVAHELGHISTHQTAIAFTRLWRIRLGVTQVGDRDDIFAKLHLFFHTAAKPAEEQDTEQKDQLAADHVALYALVRAGYAPSSFTAFMNESMQNKGKTGNAVTDFFGITHESSRRYRSALKLIADLPVACQRKQPASSAAFLAWQRWMVEDRGKTVAEAVPGDRPLQLDPPLRPSLWRIRFSPDGRYLLAQDEGSITVADRIAAKVLFRIEALDAQAAQFTPDSQALVFHDSKLRVERWSLATGERASVKEMVVFDGCNQSLLAADGKTLVCVNINPHQGAPRISLRILDVESGQTILEKPGFYELGFFSPEQDYLALELGSVAQLDLVTLVASPDGRYVVASVGNQVLAYDLLNRRPVALGGKLRGLAQTRMSFVGPDELYIVGDPRGNGLFHAQILSFPEGNLLHEAEIGAQQIDSVTRGKLLAARPLKDYAVGILDPYQSKFTAAVKLSALDVWDTLAATEEAAGGLAVGLIGDPKRTRIPLPLGPLPSPRAAAFSPGGKYLAVSLRNRAEVWNLDTGKQVALIRPFSKVWIDPAGRLFGTFPKFIEKDESAGAITLDPLTFLDFGKPDAGDWQYRNLQFRFKPMGKDKSNLRHATLEARSMESHAVAWTRDFDRETPAFWPAEDDRLALAWDLNSDAARSELKSHPALESQAAALRNPKRGLLLETVVPETGAPLEQVVLPDVDLYQGWNDEGRAMLSGPVVLIRGEHGNTALYRMDSGLKVGEFFGTAVATDAASHRIAAVNREQEVLIVDELTGKELQRFSLSSPVRAARIVPGRQLLVLTADQVVHRIPLPE